MAARARHGERLTPRDAAVCHPVSDLGGAATIVMIIVVAGARSPTSAIASEHVVGRRRMTLFNLRPKYTSTIFAVGFGMLIAIVVVAFLLVVSSEARQALFSINKLNDQITQLSAERDQLLDSPVIFRAGEEAITQPFIIKSTDPLPVIERGIERPLRGGRKRFAQPAGAAVREEPAHRARARFHPCRCARHQVANAAPSDRGARSVREHHPRRRPAHRLARLSE